MANSPSLFQPFNALGNVCPISNFYSAGQGTVLFNNWDNVQSGTFSQGVKCNNCCSSAGYCISGSEHCAAPTCLFDYGIPCDMAKYSSGLKMSNMDRSHVGNVPYGKAIRSCTVKGTVALTYDDGPCEWTSDLLDLLKKNNVKATFFVIGWKICKGHKHHFPTEYASIIKRIYAEGHQIGSHTWSHQSMDKKTTSERSEDMVKLELALSDILGVIPTYWRPPFGECRTEQCQSDLGVLGYHTTLWDVETRDWQGNYTFAKDQFISHISRTHSSESSALTVLHETHKRTVHELTQWMIDRSHEQGYSMVRLGECLNDPEQNWYRYPSSKLRPTPHLD